MADTPDLSALDNLFTGPAQPAPPAPKKAEPKEDPVPTADVAAQKAATDTGTPFRIGYKVIDLVPIRLRDWPEASKLIFTLRFDSLADLAYLQSTDSLVKLIKVAARHEEIEDETVFDMLNDMTDKDYKILKRIMTQQNDIDMERVLKDVSRITGRKNTGTPTSQS